MLRPEILAYYQRGVESDRLRTGAGRLEYLRTWDILTRTLPAAPARLLDIGGAVGNYAAPLAAAGYAVHLIDPVPGHVAQAARLPGITATTGDARALPVPDASADATLMLGPLYHLLDSADRIRAWAEAGRAVRPGGTVVAATISRYASLLDGYVQGHHTDPRFRAIVAGALADGVHRNDGDQPGWFTTAYFHHPDQTRREAAAAGLTVTAVLAVETPLWTIGDRLDAVLADPAQLDELLGLARAIEAEPSLLGASSHLLTVARRP